MLLRLESVGIFLSALSILFLLVIYFHQSIPSLDSNFVDSHTEQFEEDGTTKLELFDDISMLITTHPIPSHPSLKHLDQFMESIQYLKGINIDTMPIILACDYPKDSSRNASYSEFKQAAISKYPQIQIMNAPKADGLCHNVRSGMSAVKTKYVLSVQHDMPFALPLEIGHAMEVMEGNDMVKYIRFNQAPNQCANIGCDDRDCSFYREQRFPIGQTADKCMALVRTVCWSDNNHLTTVAYYENTVFPRCNGGAMEHVMASYSTAKTHHVTGTYIYGPLEFHWQVEHEDGSETRPQNHKRRKDERYAGPDYNHSQFTQSLPIVDGPCQER